MLEYILVCPPFSEWHMVFKRKVLVVSKSRLVGLCFL